MKFNFNRWSLGGKLIFIALCLAIFSLFLKWVDLGILSASGFQQDGYLFLVLFAYPVYVVLADKPMNKIIGLISSSLAVIIGLYFAFSKSVELFGSTVNAAGSGLYLFIISAVILVAGVFKYENAAMETSKEPLN
ncbi:MAG: hypothetical protein QMB61_09605 [Clostridiaceae bacterium]